VHDNLEPNTTVMDRRYVDDWPPRGMRRPSVLAAVAGGICDAVMRILVTIVVLVAIIVGVFFGILWAFDEVAKRIPDPPPSETTVP